MTSDETRFVRPYVPPAASAASVSPAAPVAVPAPPKPPTFRRRTVRATASVPATAPDSGVPAEPGNRRRVVGAILALVVVAGGLTAYIARPKHPQVATPVAQPTDLYLPTAGAAPGVTGSQAVTSQGARPSPSSSTAASHGASASARPPTFVAGPPVAPALTGPSPSANPMGVNLAVGKPTAASSTEADAWDAKYAVDGDPGTRWGSQWSDPQWIRVDLGSLWTVSRVVLQWETAHATRYAIETSTDGTTWTTVRTVDNGDGGTDDVSFPPVAARYVMMFGTHRSSGYGYSLWELEIH